MNGMAVQLAPDSVAPSGSLFRPTSRHIPAIPPFGAFGDDEDALLSWVYEKWNILFELKRPETERLKICELFYAGFHYADPWDNRNNPVTNYCFSTVETLWPILTQARPRPEPVPRRFLDANKIKRLRDFATYKMDSTGFDAVLRKVTRDLLKYGWCVPILSWDAKGRSIPKYWSPFDFYPDTATEESGLEMFALAAPVSVRRLRACFPDVADKIQPDNIASPSYDVMVRPYLEAAGTAVPFGAPNIIGPMPSATFEGEPGQGTSSYSVDTGYFQAHGQTAFVIQLFVRDYTTMNVKYVGDRYINHEDGTFTIPHSMVRQEPCCPSGWRMIPVTAGRVLLSKPLPVDACLGGIPLVIGRNIEQGGRFYPKGDLDDVIPIQRAINREDQTIDRALELQGNPPVTCTQDGVVGVDKSSVEGGEIIYLKRGALMQFLQPQGLAESHFVRRAGRRQDVQIVSGTPDSLQGQRPVGVEAAAAIRQIVESGTSRARAKGPAILEFMALLLQKMIHADLKKSEEVIYFRSSDGTDMSLNPADFDPSDFEIRWASESGNAQSEQDRQDTDLQLFDRQIIDGQQVLEDMDYPDRAAISQRVQIQQIQQAAAAAQAAAQAPKNGGGKP